MHFVDGFERVEVVDARVQAHLVQHENAGLLCLGVEFLHGWREIRRGHHVFLEFDGRFDYVGVVGPWDQADYQFTVFNKVVNILLLFHVKLLCFHIFPSQLFFQSNSVSKMSRCDCHMILFIP
eukprot:Lithocolla_globosa_v1_NODE_3626_length_1621_cov_8.644955.p2 type:complete len:123 gc:universal NODE_3626_length_1621_cov_8.644955:1087-1455(+)